MTIREMILRTDVQDFIAHVGLLADASGLDQRSLAFALACCISCVLAEDSEPADRQALADLLADQIRHLADIDGQPAISH